MNPVEDFDSEAFEEGMLDGMMECLLEGPGVMAHKSMGADYYGGFWLGMEMDRAWRAGEEAAKNLNVSCAYLADDAMELELSDQWLNGLWFEFTRSDAKGFSA